MHPCPSSLSPDANLESSTPLRRRSSREKMDPMATGHSEAALPKKSKFLNGSIQLQGVYELSSFVVNKTLCLRAEMNWSSSTAGETFAKISPVTDKISALMRQCTLKTLSVVRSGRRKMMSYLGSESGKQTEHALHVFALFRQTHAGTALWQSAASMIRNFDIKTSWKLSITDATACQNSYQMSEILPLTHPIYMLSKI